MKRIPIYLLVVFAACFLYLPAHAQSVTWNTDQMLSVSTENTTTPDVAVSGNRAVAVWAQRDGDFDHIYASYSTNGGETWSTPQLIEDNFYRAQKPRVFMSGEKVVAIWEQFNGSVINVYSNFSTDGGVTWLATASPQRLNTVGSYDAGETSAAMSGDNIVVVWAQLLDGSFNRIYANTSTNAGVTWGTPVQISSTTSTIAKSPHVAISGGNAAAVWQQEKDPATNFYLIRANASADAGLTWGTDAAVDNTPSQQSRRPQIAVSDDAVVAVWDTEDASGWTHMYSNRTAFSGGTVVWTPANAQLLEDTATGFYDVEAKIAMFGQNVIVAWQRWDASNHTWLQSVQSGNAGASWSLPVTLDGSASGINRHELILMERYAVAIWQYDDGSLAKVRTSASFDEGESWTDPEAIDSSTLYNNFDMKIAASGNNLVSVYARYNSDPAIDRVNIYVNSAAYSSGGVGPIPGAGGGGGSCFIASAAFGSPLASQVDSLRKFRDGYLLTNSLGRKFVAWYYANGPAAAQFISDKPMAKAFVRVALYPLVGFSFLLVNGYLPFALAGLLLAAIAFLYLRRRKTAA